MHHTLTSHRNTLESHPWNWKSRPTKITSRAGTVRREAELWAKLHAQGRKRRCPPLEHGKETYVTKASPSRPPPSFSRELRTHGKRKKQSTDQSSPARHYPAKTRTIPVRLISMAMTGFFYSFTRPRTSRPMSMLKYDPVGMFMRFVHPP